MRSPELMVPVGVVTGVITRKAMAQQFTGAGRSCSSCADCRCVLSHKKVLVTDGSLLGPGSASSLEIDGTSQHRCSVINDMSTPPLIALSSRPICRSSCLVVGVRGFSATGGTKSRPRPGNPLSPVIDERGEGLPAHYLSTTTETRSTLDWQTDDRLLRAPRCGPRKLSRSFSPLRVSELRTPHPIADPANGTGSHCGGASRVSILQRRNAVT